MNIFILHRDPYVAASMACDRHVIKMAVESCQMLATVIKAHGGSARYKPTHAGHPCTIWTGRTAHNFAWLWHHGLALCEEYTLRYGKIHACEQLLKGELRRVPSMIPRAGLQEFVQCMPEHYRTDDPVIAYRRFYLGEKAHFCKWTNQIEPLWFTLKQPELEM